MITITRRTSSSGATFSILILFLSTLAAPVCAGLNIESIFKVIETEHPACDSPADLAVAEEMFVPVANDLAGVEDYNRLTGRLADKDWRGLIEGINHFMIRHETSPLREAAAFLGVYGKLKRARTIDSAEYQEGLQAFSEVKLLYPGSSFTPSLVALIAARNLQAGLYEKSLALYRAAREEFPFDPLNCIFQAGTAESSYFLRDFSGAKLSYQQLLQKCRNERLRLVAEVRVAQITAQLGGKSATETFQRVYASSPKTVEIVLPFLLYSLGEIKYRLGLYPSSKFFLNEYLKYSTTFECKAYAAKRLADASARSIAAAKQTIGEYLAVKETYPATDAGRFSHVHALLLGLAEIQGAERERRIRVIDEEIDLVGNKSLRSAGYLEKGLALLAGGEPAAIRSLLRVKENSSQRVTDGKIGDFIRAKGLDLLSPKIAPPVLSGEALFSELELYEILLNTWLVGHPEERRGRDLTKGRLLKLVDQSFTNGDPSASLRLLEKGFELKLLTAAGDPYGAAGFKQAIAERYLSLLYRSEPRKKVADWILENRERIAPFVTPSSRLLFLSAGIEADDDETVTASMGRSVTTQGGDRAPASVTALPSELRDYYRFNEGKAYSILKQWSAAETRLASIQTKALQVKANQLRLEVALNDKQFARAFSLALLELDQAKDDKLDEMVKKLVQISYDGKLWSKTDTLRAKLKPLPLSEAQWAPAHFLAGKAFWETNRCRQSSEHYELALLRGPLAVQANEARFQLGKCYQRLGKAAQAKKVWNELLVIQDPFWSKLASNELAIMSQ